MCFHFPGGAVFTLIYLIVFPEKQSNCLYNQAAGIAFFCMCASVGVCVFVCVGMSVFMFLAQYKRVFVIIRITA